MLIIRHKSVSFNSSDHKDLPATYRQWTVKEVSSVTHNTKLLVLSPPPTTCQFSVPVGHHVIIRTVIEDMEILRPYTPVTDLNTIISAQDDTSLLFLIKMFATHLMPKRRAERRVDRGHRQVFADRDGC